MAAVSSPCIRLCTIDPASNLCLGCGRTLGEIAGWAALSESERHAVMETLPARRAAAFPPVAPDLP